MAFSVLRNFGLKFYYGISSTPEVLAQSIKPGQYQNYPILSNNIDTTSQLTSVRWRTKVPKHKKTGQFPPDLFKVSYKFLNISRGGLLDLGRDMPRILLNCFHLRVKNHKIGGNGMVLVLINHDIISIQPIGHFETFKDEEYFSNTRRKEIE